MKRELYDIWQEMPTGTTLPMLMELRWRCQLVGYVGYFRSEEDAKRYAQAVQQEREKRP